MIIHQRVLHFQIEAREECLQLNLLVDLPPGSPAVGLPAFTFWVGKAKAFYAMMGKIIPECDLEASGVFFIFRVSVFKTIPEKGLQLIFLLQTYFWSLIHPSIPSASTGPSIHSHTQPSIPSSIHPSVPSLCPALCQTIYLFSETDLFRIPILPLPCVWPWAIYIPDSQNPSL